MNNPKLIIFLIFMIVSLVSCVPRKRKIATTQKLRRTGEIIAVDNLIRQYEREHQQLYKEFPDESDHLEWPALDNKDLSHYCKKYLQHITTRSNHGATGIKMRKRLHYGKENTGTTNETVMVQCKIRYKTGNLSYYMTRAHEPNCVYAIKCSGGWKNYIFSIVHKHCDFDEKPLMNRSLKRKRVEIIGKLHRGTGQPIAKEKYLLKYELEHQEMIKKMREAGKRIQWSYAVAHHNLNSYCNQYIRECCPYRNPEIVSGSWNYEKLHYEKLDTQDVNVTTVTCLLTSRSTKLPYYITRALEANCVYTLLRKGRGLHDSYVIIFKHCDFEYPVNDQQTNSQGNVILDMNLIPKTEIKEEVFDTLETLPLFPED